LDPLYLWVTLALTIVLYLGCLINTGADPAPAGAHGHGHDSDAHDPDESHGHDEAGHHGEAAPSNGH
jgi:hypothetical protein